MRISEAGRRVTAARMAQPAWAKRSLTERCKLLGTIRNELATNCESIANSIAHEAKKHPLDALSGDVLVTLEHIRYCELNAAKALRPHRQSKPPFFFRGCSFETHYEAHGVVLVVSPSNYPLQLSLIPLISALVAGNAVILKCSERTPDTAALIARLCAYAGLSTDLVQVLSDGPEQVSEIIDEQPDFVFFTGSSGSGKHVAERAVKHLIPGIFELGGKDASICFADCQMERAIEGITYGAFSNAGKVCVAVKRAYIEASMYADFVERLVQRVSHLRIGDELDTDFPPYAPDARSQLRLQIEDTLDRGATLLWPENPDDALVKPTILTGVSPQAILLTEESFGPILCVFPFTNEREAIELANSVQFALGGSVWTRDRARAKRVAGQLTAGSCAVNDVIRVIANPNAPFGGNNLSGHGRYHGAEGLRAFAKTKTVMTTHTRRTREINWFPFKEKTWRQLAGLVRFRHGSANLFSRLTRIVLPVLLCIALPFGTLAQSNPESRLSVVVELSANARGDLGYLVFASSAGFPGDPDKALRRGFSPIPLGAKQMQLALDLPCGVYAVALYEDQNRNHKLDHSWFGIPREPVGVSNNAAAHFGPPKFGESSFHLGTIAQTITIRMVRP